MTEEEVNTRINEFETKRNKRILQAIMGLVGVLIVVTFNFWYTAYSNEQDDQKWCALMVSLDDRYQELPSTADADARLFAAQVHVLRQDLHCSPSSVPSVSPAPSGS